MASDAPDLASSTPGHAADLGAAARFHPPGGRPRTARPPSDHPFSQTVPENRYSAISSSRRTLVRRTELVVRLRERAILGPNIFNDFFAGIRDGVGGRSVAYERELHNAREELADAVRHQGGTAIVGVDLDYEVVGQGGSMLMVSASGTAVTVD